MTLCRKCGGSRLTMVNQEHHLQIFRCDGCGEVTCSRMYPTEEVFDEDPVRVFFTWSHREATARDAASVKGLVASDLPISDLLHKLRTQRVWDAGIHSRHHAAELSKRAGELDIKIELKKVRGDAPPRS